jgi:hypothetical protein
VTQPILFAIEDGEHALAHEGAAADRREKQAEKIRRSKIAELLFCLKATELGYDVKWMQGNCKGYDIILDRAGMRPMFVQVKYSLAKPANIGGDSKYYDINNSAHGTRYDRTAYDVLAVYLWDRNEWVLYTRDELGNRIGAKYTPPDLRIRAVRPSACDARDPNNWELLDALAESSPTNQ